MLEKKSLETELFPQAALGWFSETPKCKEEDHVHSVVKGEGRSGPAYSTSTQTFFFFFFFAAL